MEARQGGTVAEKHPYTSGQSGLVQTVAQLKRSFPATFNADTLKKLSIAPNNESYILNILKFLAVIDGENKKIEKAGKVFLLHGEDQFKEGFAKLVFDAYHELFELHGPGAWELDTDKLIGFFRQSDSTTDLVGRRQATTFQTLAKIAGKLPEGGAASPAPKPRSVPAGKRVTKTKSPQAPVAPVPPVDTDPLPQRTRNGVNGGGDGTAPMALTVRVEINLPAGGDQQTYDNIFKSIRENLLNGST
jgi:hypothetical protein